ncbi:MAG: hypothetical protein MJZ06_09620 [Bacteroidaceae bacterium]|nr:hypothetical protein [Bacteroidaceae bacterium]
MKLLGISRDSVYSPGRESADSDLFTGVAERLVSMGCTVQTVTEREFCAMAHDGKVMGLNGIFHMSRSAETVGLLSGIGIPAVNSAQSVMNCQRTIQDRIFHQAGVEVPESRVCLTSDGPGDWSIWPAWIKRGDSHSVLQSDVVMVHDPADCVRQMAQMASRGISKCLVQKHVHGTLVKVYGVSGEWVLDCRVVTGEKDKFGNVVKHGSQGTGIKDILNTGALNELIRRAAVAVECDVFGADVIVDGNGNLTIIDFNDWPSFGTCRDRAAAKIAELLVKKFE